MSEQLLEGVSRKGVPGNGVRDGREDPVEFPQHGSPVSELAGDFLQLVESDLRSEVAEVVPHDEPPERHLDGGGEAGSEQICSSQLRVHGKQLVLATCCQLYTVPEESKYFK